MTDKVISIKDFMDKKTQENQTVKCDPEAVEKFASPTQEELDAIVAKNKRNAERVAKERITNNKKVKKSYKLEK